MGLTQVSLKITNPKDNNKFVQGDFLVDSGASYTVLPQRMVNKLKIKPSWTQKFSLADGKKVTRDIGSAVIEFRGRKMATPVVLGLKHDSPLLGVITLESFGLSLNPFQRKIYETKLMLA